MNIELVRLTIATNAYVHLYVVQYSGYAVKHAIGSSMRAIKIQCLLPYGYSFLGFNKKDPHTVEPEVEWYLGYGACLVVECLAAALVHVPLKVF